MISQFASYLPETVLTNEQLAAVYPGWSAEKIFEKTGIRERRIVSANECASDLAYNAAEQLFLSHDRTANFLLFCTQNPDYLLPTTACLLQHRLGLPTSCAALDFNLGCSGYIYGLSLSNALIQSGSMDSVLLLTADAYSRLIHPMDKSTRTIFGDAGTATMLSKDSAVRIHSFVLGSDGSGGEQLMVKQGGARNPKTEQSDVTIDDSGNVLDSNCLFMNGPEIFNFTIRAVPALIRSILGKAKLSMDDIDLVVFHQANAFMLEHLRRKIGIQPDRFVVHIELCGNTVSSTIPLALEHALKTGRLRRGMRVLLAGFGVGYSWGGCIVDWQ